MNSPSSLSAQSKPESVGSRNSIQIPAPTAESPFQPYNAPPQQIEQQSRYSMPVQIQTAVFENNQMPSNQNLPTNFQTNSFDQRTIQGSTMGSNVTVPTQNRFQIPYVPVLQQSNQQDNHESYLKIRDNVSYDPQIKFHKDRSRQKENARHCTPKRKGPRSKSKKGTPASRKESPHSSYRKPMNRSNSYTRMSPYRQSPMRSVKTKQQELDKLLHLVHVHMCGCSEFKKDLREMGGSRLLDEYRLSLKRSGRSKRELFY